MKILVFGKTGQVATCLQQQASVTALGRDQADLTDPAACAAVITDCDADIIINAAAYTAVDKAETDAETAELVNHKSIAAMGRAAAARNIPFLHISTDYVFPGNGTYPWDTDAATGPLGVYGKTKLRGEQALVSAGGTYAVLRTSWVFSAHGNNFVKTMLRLGKEKDLLSIVDDQIGGPTAAADIAATLLTMARAFHARTASSGIWHYAGTSDCSWADFATEIFSQAGIVCTVMPIPTSNYPTPATRPLNSRMNCTKLEQDFHIIRPDWQASLADVLIDLGEVH